MENLITKLWYVGCESTQLVFSRPGRSVLCLNKGIVDTLFKDTVCIERINGFSDGALDIYPGPRIIGNTQTSEKKSAL